MLRCWASCPRTADGRSLPEARGGLKAKVAEIACRSGEMWRAGSTPRKLPTTRSVRERRKNFFANRVGELYRVRVSANDS